jgi:hypothetical protein
MWRRIVLIIVIISQHAHSLTFTLERLQEQCFLQRCAQAQRLSGNFFVEGRADTGRVDFKVPADSPAVGGCVIPSAC